MGLWSNVKHLFSAEPQQKAETGTWNGQGFHFNNWANSNFFGTHNNVLRTNEEVFGVISRLANTLSSLPIHEYKDYDQINTTVSDLLHSESNPSMSAFQLINQLEVSRNTDGNAYAWIERDEQGTPINYGRLIQDLSLLSEILTIIQSGTRSTAQSITF